MANTVRLSLPLVAAGQAQKHVTVNEALLSLDDLLHLSVISRTLATPPATPAAGARYIVPANATGAWSGRATQIAAWRDEGWIFHAPKLGWIANVEDTGGSVRFTGAAWDGASEGVALMGVNAVATTAQRLNVRSPGTLLDQEGGDHRLTINRLNDTRAATALFTTNYQTNAEIGMASDNRFRVKVSANGTAFTSALTIEQDGTASVVGPPTLANGIATKSYVDTAATHAAFDYQTASAQAHGGSTSWVKVINFSAVRIASAAFSTAQSTFTAPKAGVYLFTGQVHLTMGGTASTALAAFAKNNAPGGNWSVKLFGAGVADGLVVTSLLSLAAGDVVTLMLYCNSPCTVSQGYTGFGGTNL